MAMRRAAIVVLLVLLPAAVAQARPARKHGRRVSARYVNMPRGWTWPASAAMKRSGQACLAELDRAGVAWKPAPASRGVTTPVYVPEMRIGEIELEPVWRKGPFVMDCRLALTLADNASALHGLGVRALRFSTIYQYRNVRKQHRVWPMLSRHAAGLAVDVYEFALTDGRVLEVKWSYTREPVLKEIESLLRGSPRIRGLLTPGNDRRSHPDHFHIEADMPIEE